MKKTIKKNSSLTLWNGEPLTDSLRFWLQQHYPAARTFWDLREFNS